MLYISHSPEIDPNPTQPLSVWRKTKQRMTSGLITLPLGELPPNKANP